MARQTSRKLVDAQTITASGSGSAFTGFGFFSKFKATLVGSAIGGTTPSFTFKIQDSIDGGTTWNDVITFTAMTANGSESKSYAEVEAATAQVVGDLVRAVWTVTGTSPTGQFTLTLYAAR